MQLWNGNLNNPPDHNLRAIQIYNVAFGNMEVLASIPLIASRLGTERYLNSVTRLCQWQYLWPDGGAAYLMHLEGLHCLIPGNWLEKRYMCSQGHHYNYQALKLNTSPNNVSADRSWRTIRDTPANNPCDQRRNEMLMNLLLQNYDQQNNVNAPGFGYSEEGKSQFLNTSMSF